jgi:hypothetical protein
MVSNLTTNSVIVVRMYLQILFQIVGLQIRKFSYYNVAFYTRILIYFIKNMLFIIYSNRITQSI